MTTITQLYEQLELFTEGDPPRHILFVMGQLLGTPDQLLLIDPPADVTERFSLAENTAVLFTGKEADVALPRLQTMPGGVAHVRVGQHLLDIYTQDAGNVVLLPAVGILCAGMFGSDLALPELVPGSDGSYEVEMLRLLAQLVKQRKLQLYVPRVGSLCSDKVEAMNRLANDVRYLHLLQDAVPAATRRSQTIEQVQQASAVCLPENRRTPVAVDIHRRNVETIYETVRRRQQGGQQD